jgi:hypothetical protein
MTTGDKSTFARDAELLAFVRAALGRSKPYNPTEMRADFSERGV